MHINGTEPIKDLDGDVIKQRVNKGLSTTKCDKCGKPQDDIEESDLTVSMAVVNSLNGVFEDSSKLSASEKLDRFNLAIKIHNQPLPVEISNKEKELILKLVAQAYPSPIVVARVNEAMVELKKE